MPTDENGSRSDYWDAFLSVFLMSDDELDNQDTVETMNYITTMERISN